MGKPDDRHPPLRRQKRCGRALHSARKRKTNLRLKLQTLPADRSRDRRRDQERAGKIKASHFKIKFNF